MIASVLILTFVTLQRLAELVIARRNTRQLLAAGGVEVGAEHYPLIVGLHSAWIVGLWLLARDEPPDLAWLAVYAVLQVLRVWVLASIGRRWTTRIIVVPGETLVRRGPYRFLSHPNYAVVVAEIAVLPLVFDMPAYAAVFTLLNASVLWIRIRAEGAALRANAAPVST
ncbi:isoprenylcysteine carboxyl methyltransferase family protein [Phenylobacterium deserti]|uniref:Isoprenylcysteine carboxyl methyltransferase n=1 Tax=Phenylobacterium deserti TaxID=1914756 RepID=A0A328ACT7_9CAUL|nr:isoprenylcysteine carboxylmethyltransferase family protein [Phenylobacterium deserti]RAK52026.1 hypothetical protein DJ018_12750 [Phenylobacterium deserti]